MSSASGSVALGGYGHCGPHLICERFPSDHHRSDAARIRSLVDVDASGLIESPINPNVAFALKRDAPGAEQNWRLTLNIIQWLGGNIP